ncbi:hypothetical protein [Streptomyces malaysiensis]|nr:hypothetical protein [Streptomyces malaysiensis]ATL80254.1 hypothetical protein SMALA_0009 [Streptomyces malaysiensis]
MSDQITTPSSNDDDDQEVIEWPSEATAEAVRAVVETLDPNGRAR